MRTTIEFNGWAQVMDEVAPVKNVANAQISPVL
jgi:hypothetical protein